MNNKKTSSAEVSGGVNKKKKEGKINIVAFIGCVLLAFVMWVYVMNVKMSDNTKTFSIVPDIKGESALLNETGFSIFGTINDTVKITIKGTKAEIQKYSEKDFKVYVDVSSVDEAGLTPLSVIVESPSAALTVVSVEPSIFTVMIDKKETREISLVINSSNDMSGIVFEPSAKHISVTGPKSYLDKITVAKGTIDVDENDIGTETALTNVVLLDENEAPILVSFLDYEIKDLSVLVSADATAEK